MIGVLEHALDWFRSASTGKGLICDGVVLLQPTSPMRKTKHVIGAIDLYVRSRLEGREVAGVHTVSPVPESLNPANLWRPKETGNGLRCDPGRSFPMVRIRNDISDGRLYYRNGAAVVLDPKRLRALTLEEGAVLPYIIDEMIMTIDTPYDLQYVGHCGGKLEPDPIEVKWESRASMRR